MKSNRKVLFSVITIGFILFIFSNSMHPGPESGKESQYIMNLINHFLASLKINFGFSDFFIRKTGHFSEYFILGILLTLTVGMYRLNRTESLFLRLFLLLLVPVFDEFIQVFTPERGSSVADVLLDFCGGLVGMALCVLIVSLRSGKKPAEQRIHRV